ncbi:MAG: DUF7373 family lipoprotein, partial [Jiangellaceae bacterium]
HQATGAVLGAVAVVAGGVFAFAQPTPPTAPDVADTPSDSASPSPTTTPSLSPSDVTPDDLLLPASELEPVEETRDGTFVEWAESDPLPDLGLDTCGPPDLAYEQRWFAPVQPVPADSPQWTGATQLAGQPGDAEVAFDTISGMYARCAAMPTGEIRYAVQWDVGRVGDQAYLATYLIRTDDAELGREMQVGVARTGPYVTTLIRQVAQQEIGTPDRMVHDLSAAVNRLCALTGGGACAGEAELTPVVVGAAPPAGYLTPGDAESTLGTTGAWEVLVEAFEPGPGAYGHACAEFDEVAGLQVFEYSVGTRSQGEATREVLETVLIFPDEDSAAAAAAAMTASFDACEQTHPQLEVNPVGEAVWSWAVVDGGDASQWWGLVRSGSTVAMVAVGVQETDGVTDEAVVDLVELAGARLGELE